MISGSISTADPYEINDRRTLRQALSGGGRAALECCFFSGLRTSILSLRALVSTQVKITMRRRENGPFSLVGEGDRRPDEGDGWLPQAELGSWIE